MKSRTRLAGLALVGLLLVASTGGASTIAADRPVEVSVVPDDRAYLGIETVDQSLDPGHHESVSLVELENRFAGPITGIDIAVDGDDETPPVLQSSTGPNRIPTGGTGTITATINCDAGAGSPDTETWSVTLTASGQAAAVELTRTVTVTCESGAGQNGTPDASPPGTSQASQTP